MRHIIAISGGKDSAALALYMRPRLEKVEYIFCDTGAELPELYEFLERLECVLGQKIVRLTDTTKDHPERRDLFYYVDRWDFLPSVSDRWCTKHLKIRPFERYIKQQGGGPPAKVYIAFRADEQRKGNYGLEIEKIEYLYPFVEDGVDFDGVMKILKENEIELPEFYAWRATGGCYLCPFQRRSDWMGLKRHHPDLFAKAKQMEIDHDYTWNQTYTLTEIEAQGELPMRSSALTTTSASCGRVTPSPTWMFLRLPRWMVLDRRRRNFCRYDGYCCPALASAAPRVSIRRRRATIHAALDVGV